LDSNIFLTILENNLLAMTTEALSPEPDLNHTNDETDA
jgi:hypothetical protein